MAQLSQNCQRILQSKAACIQRTVQPIIGREGETATLLSRCLVSLNLCGGGFAPRQLRRSAFLG